MFFQRTLCFGMSAFLLGYADPGYSNEPIGPLDCKTLIERHPLPYTDGRVTYFCERAFKACLLEKAVLFSKQELEREIDPKKRARESKKLEDLLAGNKSERDHYLKACQVMFNFFVHPENTIRIFEEGL